MAVFGVVYLILNTVNGKRYVGQTVQPLEKRFNEHARSKKSLIGKAIRKYGKDKFRYGVIKVCASKEEMDYWEKYFIAALKSKKPYGYNLTDGGEGTIGLEFTPERRARLAESRRGEKNPGYGKPMPAEQSAKISISNRDESPYKNLIAELNANNLSYSALAKILGLSPATVSAKMRGKVKFTNADKAKLEKFFDKPSEYLLQLEDGAEVEHKDLRKSPYKNLITELDKQNINYGCFAQMLGLSYDSIYKRMCGKYNFTVRDRAKLIEIFNKPIEYLMERDDGKEVEKTMNGNSPYKNLITELNAYELTYTALAERLGLDMSAVSLKMRGKCNFTARDKVKLVEIFNKPIEYLLERDDGKDGVNPARKKLQPHSPEECSQRSIKQRGKSPYKNLIAELDDHNLSYNAFAKLLGLSQSVVSAKIRGEHNFTTRDKAKLVEIFNKPIEYLLARSED